MENTENAINSIRVPQSAIKSVGFKIDENDLNKAYLEDNPAPMNISEMDERVVEIMNKFIIDLVRENISKNPIVDRCEFSIFPNQERYMIWIDYTIEFSENNSKHVNPNTKYVDGSIYRRLDPHVTAKMLTNVIREIRTMTTIVLNEPFRLLEETDETSAYDKWIRCIEFKLLKGSPEVDVFLLPKCGVITNNEEGDYLIFRYNYETGKVIW